MIDCYTWPTPNGHKIHIMLEETGLEYNVHAINIGEGEQFKPDFLKISPNNKMPAIIDRDGPQGKEISVFETGAILVYLGRKTGQFLPRWAASGQCLASRIISTIMPASACRSRRSSMASIAM
jgi:GST-like protein